MRLGYSEGTDVSEGLDSIRTAPGSRRKRNEFLLTFAGHAPTAKICLLARTSMRIFIRVSIAI